MKFYILLVKQISTENGFDNKKPPTSSLMSTVCSYMQRLQGGTIFYLEKSVQNLERYYQKFIHIWNYFICIRKTWISVQKQQTHLQAKVQSRDKLTRAETIR